MIFVKYKNKYRIYHHVFWNKHTCLYFPTHVWFLPNTLTCLMYLVKSTLVVKTTHMIVQVIIGNSHTCLVFFDIKLASQFFLHKVPKVGHVLSGLVLIQLKLTLNRCKSKKWKFFQMIKLTRNRKKSKTIW